MTFKKAMKTLARKGNGFIVPISIMQSGFLDTDDFVTNIFNKGISVGLRKVGNTNEPTVFEIIPMGSPIMAANICILGSADFLKKVEEKDTDQWGWYSFRELYNKLGNIKLRFGYNNSIIRSSTEEDIDLYGKIPGVLR